MRGGGEVRVVGAAERARESKRHEAVRIHLGGSQPRAEAQDAGCQRMRGGGGGPSRSQGFDSISYHLHLPHVNVSRSSTLPIHYT